MDKKKLSNLLIIIIVVAIIFFGFGYGSGIAQKAQTITVTKDIPVTKTVTVPVTKTITKTTPADTTNWQALKEIDDKGFMTESKVLAQMPDIATTCGQAVTAASNNDQQTLNQDESYLAIDTAVMKGLGVDLTNEVKQRQAILKQLGY